MHKNVLYISILMGMIGVEVQVLSHAYRNSQLVCLLVTVEIFTLVMMHYILCLIDLLSPINLHATQTTEG